MLNNAPRFNMFKPDIIYDVRLFFGLCAKYVIRLSHIMFMSYFVQNTNSGCETRPKNMLNIAPRFNVSEAWHLYDVRLFLAYAPYAC